VFVTGLYIQPFIIIAIKARSEPIAAPYGGLHCGQTTSLARTIYRRLQILARKKHSSLFWQSVIDKDKEFDTWISVSVGFKPSFFMATAKS